MIFSTPPPRQSAPLIAAGCYDADTDALMPVADFRLLRLRFSLMAHHFRRFLHCRLASFSMPVFFRAF